MVFVIILTMSLNEPDVSLSEKWDRFAPDVPQEFLDQMLPPDTLELDLDHCIGNLDFIDGSGKAPDQQFFYTVDFHFATEADRQALLDHPDRDEIVSTMEKYMRDDPGVTESFELELERDRNPVYTEAGEAGSNSLTEGTIGDLEVSVEEMIKSINETYGLNIQRGTVSEKSQQLDGCNPSSDAIPNDLTKLDSEKSAPVVAHSTITRTAGM